MSMAIYSGLCKTEEGIEEETTGDDEVKVDAEGFGLV